MVVIYFTDFLKKAIIFFTVILKSNRKSEIYLKCLPNQPKINTLLDMS